MLAGLENRPMEKMDFSLRQLKPWKSLASVSVANAIVLATAAFDSKPI